jgi:hypothetical protein
MPLHLSSVVDGTLRKFLLSFFDGDDLSLSRFSVMWQENGLEQLYKLHLNSKSRMHYDSYMQVVFDSILRLLFVSKVSGGKLQQLSSTGTAESVWNIGVLYSLYTAHRMQPQPKLIPINIGPSVMRALVNAARCMAQLGEIGASALTAYRTLWRQKAFLFCAYSGPTSLYYSKLTYTNAPQEGYSVTAADTNTVQNVLASIRALYSATTDDSYDGEGRSTVQRQGGSNSSSSSAGDRRNAVGNVGGSSQTVDSSTGVHPTSPAVDSPLPSSPPETDNSSARRSTQQRTGGTADATIMIDDAVAPAQLDSVTASSATVSLTAALTQNIPQRREQVALRAQQRKEKLRQEAELREERARTRLLARLAKADAVVAIKAEKTASKKSLTRHTAHKPSKILEPKEPRPCRVGSEKVRGVADAEESDTGDDSERSDEYQPRVGVRVNISTPIANTGELDKRGASVKRKYVMENAPDEIAPARARRRTTRLTAPDMSATASAHDMSASRLLAVNSLGASLPARVPTPRLQPSARSRAPGAGSAATASTRRRNGADYEHSGGEGGDNALIEEFEELVGLRPVRPKKPRGGSAGAVDGTAGRRQVRGASNAVSAAPALDADTADILELLGRLESDTSTVLRRTRSSTRTAMGSTTSAAAASAGRARANTSTVQPTAALHRRGANARAGFVPTGSSLANILDQATATLRGQAAAGGKRGRGKNSAASVSGGAPRNTSTGVRSRSRGAASVGSSSGGAVDPESGDILALLERLEGDTANILSGATGAAGAGPQVNVGSGSSKPGGGVRNKGGTKPPANKAVSAAAAVVPDGESQRTQRNNSTSVPSEVLTLLERLEGDTSRILSGQADEGDGILGTVTAMVPNTEKRGRGKKRAATEVAEPSPSILSVPVTGKRSRKPAAAFTPAVARTADSGAMVPGSADGGDIMTLLERLEGDAHVILSSGGTTQESRTRPSRHAAAVTADWHVGSSNSPRGPRGARKAGKDTAPAAASAPNQDVRIPAGETIRPAAGEEDGSGERVPVPAKHSAAQIAARSSSNEVGKGRSGRGTESSGATQPAGSDTVAQPPHSGAPGGAAVRRGRARVGTAAGAVSTARKGMQVRGEDSSADPGAVGDIMDVLALLEQQSAALLR